jgi:hypothetical protein
VKSTWRADQAKS